MTLNSVEKALVQGMETLNRVNDAMDDTIDSIVKLTDTINEMTKKKRAGEITEIKAMLLNWSDQQRVDAFEFFVDYLGKSYANMEEVDPMKCLLSMSNHLVELNKNKEGAE